MNPITEDDIANYLANTPDFFERHAQLLASVQLTSPHGNRAVSLQERQAEMLREKIKALEHRVMDMVRHGNENMIIADRLHRWARNLFQVQSARALPATIAARDAQPVHGAAGRDQGLGRGRPLRRGSLRAGRERGRQDLRLLAHAAVLRRELRLRGRATGWTTRPWPCRWR